MMNETDHNRGGLHAHTLLFPVESSGIKKTINNKRRPSDGPVIEGSKQDNKKRMSDGGSKTPIFQMINGVIVRHDVCLKYKFDSTHVTHCNIIKACEFAMKDIDNDYINNTIAKLDDDSLFQPLHVPERLYRCTIQNINRIPLRIFKSYVAYTNKYPSIETKHTH